MKTLLKLLTIFSVALFLLASCEGPMGPFGQDGADGKDGADGLDGKDGKDVKELCLTCHSSANMAAKEAQFELSDKGERGARSGKYCARCHTTEGFQEIVKMGTFNASNEMLNGTKHGCATCHKHSSFEFTGDTVSQVLRTIAPVYSSFDNFDMASFSYKQTNATDYGAINNLCANCHQYRGSRYPVYSDATPAVIPPATVSVPVSNVKFTEMPYFPIKNVSSNEATPVKYRAGTNFSIHEGANQADYLKGMNGYEYTGKTYTKTTAHNAFSCTDCHFNAYDATSKTGGHTMIVNKTDPSCIVCHNVAERRAATLSTVNAKLIELGDLLAARKVFKKTASTSSSALNGYTYNAQPSHDFYGTLLPTSASTDKFALTVNAANSISTSTGLLVYNNNVGWAVDSDFANRIGRDWTYGELGAAWNFTYVNTVATAENKAAHNPTYAKELLQSSIDWLIANP